MKKFIKANIWVITGMIAGSIAGYLYWKWVGCRTGTCFITSRPVHSSIYGALFGGLLLSIFKKEKNISRTGREEIF